MTWGMAGMFNARNAAMACLASALSIAKDGSPLSFKAKGIGGFRGVRRRQQIRLDTDKRIVIEDFAHHPTAIREILESLKTQYPDRRLVAAFEPRSNTSRLEVMRKPLWEALSLADAVVIGAVKQSSKEGTKVMDTQALAAELEGGGVTAQAGQSNHESLAALRKICSEIPGKQLVVFLTNGSFDGIIDRFVEDSEAEFA